uniref:Cell envelope biogenesis protein TolA n=1 Tax=Yoonia rhodophyticola TaxID=3137370 RepID=A0AAN0NIN2_9RHOB
MQTPGTYISAVGHVGLIGWLLLGWGLSADPLEFETISVTTVSSEEFENLTSAARTPLPSDAPPDAPVQPEVNETPPPAPADETPAPVPPPPTPVDPPSDEAPPPAPPPPAPETQVTDAAPTDPTPPAPPIRPGSASQ